MSVLLGLALAFSLGAQSTSAMTDQQSPARDTAQSQSAATLDSRIEQAADLIKSQKPADALTIIDTVIADFNSRYANSKVTLYAAQSGPESLAYMLKAAAHNQAAQVINENWGTAFFLKGFALVDVGRAEESKAQFDKAISLAPMNSQYLAERGEWFKSRKEWAKAYVDFEAALEGADIAPESVRIRLKGRALRGMAFVRIEEGQLDQAEKLLKQALEINRDDERAKDELKLIKSMRRSAT